MTQTFDRMLRAGDAPFGLRLALFREQQAAADSLLLLIPLAFWIQPVMPGGGCWP